MEDLLFDGTDANGKATRTFDLVVSEMGKTPVTVTVNLELTLDAATDAVIYYKDGGKWTKATEEDGTVPVITNQQASGCLALETGPVAKLKEALAWVIANAKTGTENDYQSGDYSDVENWTVERFTDGYAEYRILVKAGAGIPKVNFSCPNAKYVSLELYGAGRPGQAEHTIFFDSAKYSGINYTIQRETETNAIGQVTKTGGLFTLYNTNHIADPRSPTLVLGKNITIDGKNYEHNSTVNSTNGGIASLIYLRTSACFIMKEHSKITGYNTTKNTAYYSPIFAYNGATNVGIYIQGGTITGNVSGRGVINWDKSYYSQYWAINSADDPKTAFYYNGPQYTVAVIISVSAQAGISGNTSLTEGVANKITTGETGDITVLF
jgi:hypothetical protein